MSKIKISVYKIHDHVISAIGIQDEHSLIDHKIKKNDLSQNEINVIKFGLQEEIANFSQFSTELALDLQHILDHFNFMNELSFGLQEANQFQTFGQVKYEIIELDIEL